MMKSNRAYAPGDLDHVEAWVFDLDNTLYPASSALFTQVERRMTEFVADLLGVGHDDARSVQKDYFRAHGTTLRGLMLHHGVDPDVFLRFVHVVDVSSIAPAPALARALARLPGRKVVFTNASVAHAENVLARLGMRDLFDDIFDVVRAAYVPKPDPATYRALVREVGIAPARTVMIEDMAKNLVPAAALGMTTVWVRTDHPWSHDGAYGDHIHYVTNDLLAWIEAVVGRD